MHKISKFITGTALALAVCTPFFATAAGGINLSVIEPYSDSIITFINATLVPLLLAIAFIVFLWGIYKHFILGASSEMEKGEGRQFAMWGIIGFVIIFSLWGLVYVLMDAINLGGQNPKPPTFNTGGNTQPSRPAAPLQIPT